jgi:RHS repeat-associated protein
MPSNRGPQSAGYAGATHQERLTTTVGSTTTTWTNSPLGETNTTTGTGSSLVSYVRDPSGQLIGIRVGTSTNATRYYFTFDGLGSITGLTDSTGARVNTYRYDPYGQLLSSTEGLPQPFRYTGGIHDNATGLTKLGIRYYDPALGRFTQPDPTGQDPHYTYAANNPANFNDPSGAHCLNVNLSIASFGECNGDGYFNIGPSIGAGGSLSGDGMGLEKAPDNGPQVNCSLVILGGIDYSFTDAVAQAALGASAACGATIPLSSLW